MVWTIYSSKRDIAAGLSAAPDYERSPSLPTQRLKQRTCTRPKVLESVFAWSSQHLDCLVYPCFESGKVHAEELAQPEWFQSSSPDQQ